MRLRKKVKLGGGKIVRLCLSVVLLSIMDFTNGGLVVMAIFVFPLLLWSKGDVLDLAMVVLPPGDKLI
jgi:hypothetical protein